MCVCACVRAKPNLQNKNKKNLNWWAEVTHGEKTGGPFSEMMGSGISNQLGSILYLHTDTDSCKHKCILTADYTEKPVFSGRPIIALCRSKGLQNAPRGAFCNPFDLH